MTDKISKINNIKVIIKKLVTGILIGGSLLGLTANHAKADNSNEESLFPISSIGEYKPSMNLTGDIFYPEGVFNKRRKVFSSFNSEIFECTVYNEIGGICADGTELGYEMGIIAADWSIFPQGSEVYLEFDSYYSHLNGVYRVCDTGVSGYIIDVYYPYSYEECMKFGRRYVRVTLIS